MAKAISNTEIILVNTAKKGFFKKKTNFVENIGQRIFLFGKVPIEILPEIVTLRGFELCWFSR